ncbi:MAG: hypothetical protein WC693_03735 [Patescibacteria group bacterium]|jgi:hypothetical protein
MSEPTVFNVVTVVRTSDGQCPVCGDNFKDGATMCHSGHSTGETYHKPLNGRGLPIRLIRAEANGTRCLLCGGQVDDGNICAVLRHQMGEYYPATREHAPSLIP